MSLDGNIPCWSSYPKLAPTDPINDSLAELGDEETSLDIFEDYGLFSEHKQPRKRGHRSAA